jgi:hypothetical protein
MMILMFGLKVLKSEGALAAKWHAVTLHTVMRMGLRRRFMARQN